MRVCFSNVDGSFDKRLFSVRSPPNMVSEDERFELKQFHMDGTDIELVRAGATGKR
jgi:hypothetical protein